MDEITLSTREQLVVAVVATIAGFFASKAAENQVTKFIKSRKV